MNRDFVEMLLALSAAGAEFLIVGAHALAALVSFGAPLHDLSIDDLQQPDLVYQIGVPPGRIDILTGISGVTFSDAWPRRVVIRIEGIDVGVLGRADFERNKRASGRPKDLLDLELLGEIDQ